MMQLGREKIIGEGQEALLEQASRDALAYARLDTVSDYIDAQDV